MPKRRNFECPNCGTVVSEPTKTWQLVAPIPDRKGRITVTVMGAFECPNCSHKWRDVVSKLKIGETSVEVSGREIGIEEKREPKVIEIDLENLDEEIAEMEEYEEE
ncbi:MAG: chromatin protein Cren7 [Sulfolobales archaeon]|nr:chromatin protein Cren7 [Sulfolobales archaeon]MCX8198782.1 chromatin protein Cren7 [Sulfolobales archaeon]MDW8169855.1 chromatin protein Cren7 [Desulfurococcaceae archaeon]